MMMKRVLSLILLACTSLGLVGCVNTAVQSFVQSAYSYAEEFEEASSDKGDSARRLEPIVGDTPINKVIASGAIALEVYHSKTPRLELLAPSKKRLERIKVKQDGRGKLRLEDSGADGRSLARLYTPSLSYVKLSGAVHMRVYDRMQSEELVAVVSGASSLKMQELHTTLAEVELKGASYMQVASGHIAHLDLEVKGASRFKTDKGLHVDRAEAEVNGASSARVYALDRLDVAVNGASTVYYYGCPRELKKSVRGASRLVNKS